MGGGKGADISGSFYALSLSSKSFAYYVVTAVGLSLYLEQTICLLSYSFFFFLQDRTQVIPCLHPKKNSKKRNMDFFKLVPSSKLRPSPGKS